VELERETVMATFIGESEENLVALEAGLLGLDRAAGNDDAIAEIFRTAHTLKGNSESMGFEAMGACAHALESVLDAVRKGTVNVTPALVTVLLAGHDALQSMLAIIAAGGTPERGPYDDVIQNMTEAASGEVDAGELPDAMFFPAPVAAGSTRKARKSLRVDLATLDRILNNTGEMSIALARLRAAIHEAGLAPEAILEVDRVFEELRDQAMRLRLVPIGPMLRQQLRGVRDVAAAHGKQARLVVEGDDVEVDAAVLDGLRDPVTHMIRNSIDHALETPEVRAAAGKDPTGTITLRARYAAGWVIVDVCDDGAGFDRASILRRGRALGFVAEGAHPGDDELLRLVFVPGFSTAATVTDLSGRGVGMDVVAKNVASLKGSVSVRSTDGQGSTVTVRVPLTLAIIDGFAVRAASETYVIPMESVRECIGLPGSGGGDHARASEGIVNLRGEPLPYVRLRSILGLTGDAERTESVVVVEHHGVRAGLVVDALQGEMQAVIKPLGGGLERVDRIAGSTILGDGRVALILDVPALLRDTMEEARP